MKQSTPSLALTFNTPTHGFWDGGMKSGGTFTPSPVQNKNEVLWGSWELNFWFTSKFGKSWKDAASIARRKLQRLCNRPCSIAVEGL